MAKDLANSSQLLDSLNPIQREAVLHTDGPVLIVAGAGSGKTRVLTHRVAYLLEEKARPYQIMAVTFTNKAAQEMRDRITSLTDGIGKEAWIGTFHSLCARILRIDGHLLGYQRSFSVFDREDQIRFVRNVMNEMSIPVKEFPPEDVLRRISSAKNTFVSPAEFKTMAHDAMDQTAAAVFVQYQNRMRDNNVMDFDDLLVNPLTLFDEHSQVLEKYQQKFRYLLVDEFQDTNRTQYLLLKKLVAQHRNICAVGDDDQSIYRWRGADIQNILDLEQDFPDCKIFNLEQNYRSTKYILEAANSVVSKNLRRRRKKLWTEKGQGSKVAVLDLTDALHESQYVVEVIRKELAENSRDFSSFAILYRTNSQSRLLEESLRLAGIPYRVVGGVKFYERKEIKDVLAYLRLLCNPRDSISFKRVVNLPLRGIGETSVTRLEGFANERNVTLYEAAGLVDEVETISPKIRQSIKAFHSLIDKYATLKTEFSAGELARALVDEIGLLRDFKEIGTEEAFNRSENVRELLTAIKSKTSDGNTLDDFLEEVALLTDIDSWDGSTNAVTLMTIHSAKGLEFPAVFITGLEEGLFPLSRAYDNLDDLEEERRLFYVGATRAMERLYLLWAGRRIRFGESFANLPSRFIKELDPEFIARRDLRVDEIPRQPTFRPSSRPSKEPRYDDFRQDLPRFYRGCEVSHETFGLGRVLNLEGSGDNVKVTVNFYEHGKKKLVAKYANLEIID